MNTSLAIRSRPSWMPRPAVRTNVSSSTFLQSQPRCQQQRRGIKSIQKKVKPVSRFNTAFLPLKASPAAAIQRRIDADTLPHRSGVLAIKKGMTAIYDTESGKRIPATVLQMDRVQVTGNKTRARNGYFAVCVGHGWRHPSNVGNAMLGVYARAFHKAPDGDVIGISPKQDIKEFRVRDASGLAEVGRILTPSWFQIGQFVDARATARGFGFTGVMKRYGFSGQDRSHGVSLKHRSMGSSGGGQGSGSRVHPGKRMAGRHGGNQHTTQNLRVLQVDDANGIVVVHGGIAGPKGTLVQLQDALKKPWPDVPVDPPSPQEAAEPLREAV